MLPPFLEACGDHRTLTGELVGSDVPQHQDADGECGGYSPAGQVEEVRVPLQCAGLHAQACRQEPHRCQHHPPATTSEQ